MTTSVFCQVSDVKLHAPITSGFAAYDTRLSTLIAVASAEIKQFCRREFDKVARTEWYMSPDTRTFSGTPYRFRVSEWPIQAASVALDYDPSGEFNSENLVSTLVEDTDYIVDYDKGMIGLMNVYTFNSRGLRVTYTGGYTVTGNLLVVPPVLVTACAMQAAFLSQRGVAGQMGQGETQSGASRQKFTVSAVSGLLSEVEAAVVPFRRIMVGRR